jgi:hypothetical protein
VMTFNGKMCLSAVNLLPYKLSMLPDLPVWMQQLIETRKTVNSFYSILIENDRLVLNEFEQNEHMII